MKKYETAEDSSDDDEFWSEAIVMSRRKDRLICERRHPFDELEDNKFKERFRLNKTTVLRILEEVNAHEVYLLRIY